MLILFREKYHSKNVGTTQGTKKNQKTNPTEYSAVSEFQKHLHQGIKKHTLKKLQH